MCFWGTTDVCLQRSEDLTRQKLASLASGPAWKVVRLVYNRRLLLNPSDSVGTFHFSLIFPFFISPVILGLENLMTMQFQKNFHFEKKATNFDDHNKQLLHTRCFV